MKAFPLLLLLAVSPLSAAEVAGDAVAGRFDAYTLALTWLPTLCEGQPSATECATQKADRFDAANLALHGLWPEKDGDAAHAYGYCGVAAADRELDRAPTWCRLPPTSCSDATRAALTTVMPGVASCLDRHERLRHGSCSGMTDEAYFTLAAALARAVAQSAFGRFLTANAGRTVDASAAIAAFDRDFGADGGGKLVLRCASVRGVQALLEVRLRLPHPIRPATELAAMALATGERGNCPASFLLDPVPAR